MGEYCRAEHRRLNASEMAINLEKYKSELQEAYKDVLNEKTDTDWALFGYDKQSNDLKVVSTGSGGLEELVDDFNSGKIMYAFAKVNDPKTSLPKCVLINWQGEGANTVRKGMCANHLRDVEKFFSGANVTINARNEDEVDPQLIIDKVAKAGSVYSFKAPRGDNTGPTGPIGSNYKRVNPIQEINATERDQFWMKEEIEEKKRVEDERSRRDTEKHKLEEEAKKREALEAKVRDEKTERRNSSIDLIKQAEKVAQDNKAQQEMEQYIMDLNETKVNQSDVLRQQRNQEAQNLIAQRTIDARSIFEKNTSAGQIKKTTPEKPVRASILKAQQQKMEEEAKQEVVTTPPEVIQENKQIEEQSDDDSDQFATIKRSPKDLDKKNSITSPVEQENAKNVINKQQEPKIETVQQITEQQFVDEVLYGDLCDSGIQARALYDYQAADDTEISFDPGDLITHIELVDEGWWQGLSPDGVYGLFPANYVERL